MRLAHLAANMEVPAAWERAARSELAGQSRGSRPPTPFQSGCHLGWMHKDGVRGGRGQLLA